MDAQADLSLRWAHSHLFGFVMLRLIFILQFVICRIEPDLKISVYCTGVRVRGGSVWDKVLQRFTETQSSSERAYLLQALSSVYEPWIIKRYFGKVTPIHYIGLKTGNCFPSPLQ